MTFQIRDLSDIWSILISSFFGGYPGKKFRNLKMTKVTPATSYNTQFIIAESLGAVKNRMIAKTRAEYLHDWPSYSNF